MKRAYVLTEGPTDVQFLAKVLPPAALQDVVLVDAGGRNEAASLARSLVVRRRAPVAVFADADSLEPAVVEERRQMIEELIQAVGASIPLKVVLVVPALEACFFAAPGVIERVLGVPVPPERMVLGRDSPQAILNQLATAAQQPWDTRRAIDLLDDQDIERIRALAPLRELIDFLLGLPATLAVG